MNNETTIAIKLIAKPTMLPVSLPMAKSYLRIDHDDDDQMLESMIIAAKEIAENYLKIRIGIRLWQITYKDLQYSKLELPNGPVCEIKTIETINYKNQHQFLKMEDYFFGENSDIVFITSINHIKQLKITYLAGLKEEEVPESLKQAILIHLATLYDGRGNNSALPLSVQNIYNCYRKVRI